jgi:hypothetical protein
LSAIHGILANKKLQRKYLCHKVYIDLVHTLNKVDPWHTRQKEITKEICHRVYLNLVHTLNKVDPIAPKDTTATSIEISLAIQL